MTDSTKGERVPQPGTVVGIRVFVDGPGGGNPVPLVPDATGMSAHRMQAVARDHGHESAFVLPPSDPSADWRIRFFVPQHEMEMCGHATVGTLWALRRWGAWTTPRARIETLSGIVDAEWDEPRGQVWISQPAVQADALDAAQQQRVAAALRLQALPPSMTNAATSRVKTLVALPDAAALDALMPDLAAIEATCEAIGSTGLYPFALERDPHGKPAVYARQFPKSSGYPEDAATGIAAAALWGHLAAAGQIDVGSPAEPAVCVIRQGRAMGCPSAIELRPRFDAEGVVRGCWLSGRVAFMDLHERVR
ncbi:PhzF family phenazine biosynthesis protein [Variovorax sp. KK3]|uniref:PhzF family phenazine biosynthesis protein n=1 Tax=Variovorax sp. KK3 TaxID=1855728 RepID=UPI00097C2C15|nr:PhzF family phenazine biosynthesis isomerase [Variovorax sp. KK3]